jgi:hypothetical protein
MTEKLIESVYLTFWWQTNNIRAAVFFEKETLEPIAMDIIEINGEKSGNIPLHALVMIEDMLCRYFENELTMLIKEQLFLEGDRSLL